MTTRDVADRVSPVVVESLDSRAEASAAVNRGADDAPVSSQEKLMNINNDNNKLRIKIKLPKPDAEPESGGGGCVRSSSNVKVVKPETEEVPAAPSHVCAVCGKGFRSGKALGGHMRVHTQHIRADNVVITDGVDDGEKDDGGGGLKQHCPICKKGFPTDKALFGHMRCHPDRSWRGIQPPTTHDLILKTSSSSSGHSSTLSVDVHQPPATTTTSFNKSDDASSDDVDENLMVMSSAGKEDVRMVMKKRVDLMKDLLDSGWGAKAVRGREAALPNAAGTSGNNVEPDHDVVENLMLLSKGTVAGQELEEEADVISDSFKPIKKRKIYAATHEGFPAELDHHQGRVEIKTTRKNSKAEEEVRFKELRGNNYHHQQQPAATAVSDQHHQLMQVEHNKVPPMSCFMVSDWKSLATNLPATAQPTPATPRYNTSHPVKVEVPDGERYKCTTCNKSFSSHQAVGGHKSSHKKLVKNVVNVGSTFGGCNATGYGQAAGLNLGLTLAAAGNMAAAVPAPPIHQCNVCHKVYPSGQALGGHKRLHCATLSPKAPIRNVNVILPEVVALLRNVNVIHSTEAALPPLAPAPEAKSGDNDTSREAVCSFDLNELPPLEDEEVAAQPAASPALISAEAQQETAAHDDDDIHAPSASA